jgi:membrane-bound lytic murein transglycosylase D
MTNSRLTPVFVLAATVATACVSRQGAYQAPLPPPPAVPELETPFFFEPIPEPQLPSFEVVEELTGVLAGVDLAAFDMPIHVNDHVLAYIDVFTGRARNRFEQWLERQGVYAAIIDERLRSHGLPRELGYLALIESGFSPVAVSHANAVGLWQFIASTARLEGLEVSDFVDERRDPVRATDAALQHLQKLYDRFGSWYLAAAAYNAGSGRIERALANGADGRRGNDSIYWEVRHLLPTETRNYVPQLIAASIIGTHRHLFGFGHVRPADPLIYDVASIPDATEFAVIAEAAGVETQRVAALNTQFTRGMTPPGRRVAVRLPPGTGDRFREAYAAIPPNERVRTRVHIVAAGETLSGIARRYGTTVAALQTANRIERPDRIAIGRRLIVPTTASAALAARAAADPGTASGPSADNMPAAPASAQAAGRSTNTSAARAHAKTYTVRSGDTLSGIASRHGLSLAQLTAINGISANVTIRPGQTLLLSPRTTHTVQRGDTLGSIARRYGVAVADLRDWNRLPSDLIKPGDRLEIHR